MGSRAVTTPREPAPRVPEPRGHNPNHSIGIGTRGTVCERSKRTNWLFPLIGGNPWRRLTFNCLLHIRKPLQHLENPYLENLIPKHRSEQTSNQWPDGAFQNRGHSLGSALGTWERSERGARGVGDVCCVLYVCTHTPVWCR